MAANREVEVGSMREALKLLATERPEFFLRLAAPPRKLEKAA